LILFKASPNWSDSLAISSSDRAAGGTSLLSPAPLPRHNRQTRKLNSVHHQLCILSRNFTPPVTNKPAILSSTLWASDQIRVILHKGWLNRLKLVLTPFCVPMNGPLFEPFNEGCHTPPGRIMSRSGAYGLPRQRVAIMLAGPALRDEELRKTSWFDPIRAGPDEARPHPLPIHAQRVCFWRQSLEER